MYTPATLPNPPPLAGDYDLGDDQYCRVTVTKTGSLNGFVTYEAQAWQLTSAGQFVLDASGWPIRTPGSSHSVSLSGLAQRTASRDSGWVKYAPPSGTNLDPQSPPVGWATGTGVPTAIAIEGDRYLDLSNGQGWEWSLGELERIRRGKVDEMAQILVERAFDAQAAAV